MRIAARECDSSRTNSQAILCPTGVDIASVDSLQLAAMMTVRVDDYQVASSGVAFRKDDVTTIGRMIWLKRIRHSSGLMSQKPQMSAIGSHSGDIAKVKASAVHDQRQSNVLTVGRPVRIEHIHVGKRTVKAGAIGIDDHQATAALHFLAEDKLLAGGGESRMAHCWRIATPLRSHWRSPVPSLRMMKMLLKLTRSVEEILSEGNLPTIGREGRIKRAEAAAAIAGRQRVRCGTVDTHDPNVDLARFTAVLRVNATLKDDESTARGKVRNHVWNDRSLRTFTVPSLGRTATSCGLPLFSAE